MCSGYSNLEILWAAYANSQCYLSIYNYVMKAEAASASELTGFLCSALVDSSMLSKYHRGISLECLGKLVSYVF